MTYAIRHWRLALTAALILASGLVLAAVPGAKAATCTASLGNNCGPYSYAGIPMSNGFDTYVGPQNVGAVSGTTATATVTDPGNWNVTASSGQAGYTGVQIYANVQQLTNDWCGNGWGGCASPTDTPADSLSSLSITYSETSPQDDHGPNAAGSIYEWSPDIWSANYGADVMFWADTSPTRCNDNGLNSSNILGVASIDGQSWTVYRYGGTGSEIVFVLDTADQDPVSNDTCAQQPSGTIDILGGFNWLTSHGFVTGPEVFTQVNAGWEITDADGQPFTMNSYSISAVPGGTPPPSPSPTPTSTSPTPTPTPTTTSPSPSPSPSTSPPPVIPDTGPAWECVAGANRTAQDVYLVKANFIAFLNAHGGKCPNGGFIAAIGAPGS